MQTVADFYLLTSEVEEDRYRCACRLTHKAWEQELSVYIHCETEATAHVLDDLLWTFKDISFIPHQLLSDATLEENNILSICIGFQALKKGPPHRDILLNLTEEAPHFFEQYSRILEIVLAEAAAKKTARQRYKCYQDHGYTMTTHEIS
jgi:DNA polymerase-3 subunit chi